MYKPDFSSTAANMSRLNRPAYPQSSMQAVQQSDLFEDLNLYRPAPRSVPRTPAQTSLNRAQVLMRTLQPETEGQGQDFGGEGYLSDEEDYPNLRTGYIGNIGSNDNRNNNTYSFANQQRIAGVVGARALNQQQSNFVGHRSSMAGFEMVDPLQEDRLERSMFRQINSQPQPLEKIQARPVQQVQPIQRQPLTAIQRTQGLGNIPRSPARANLFQDLNPTDVSLMQAQGREGISPDGQLLNSSCRSCQSRL